MHTIDDARAFMERARREVEREETTVWAYETARRLADSAGCIRGDAESFYRDARGRMADYAAVAGNTAAALSSVRGTTEAKVLRLRYLEGMRWKDVASALGMSESGIMSAHRRALACIASYLDSTCADREESGV